MPDESPTEPVGYDPAADRKLILQAKKMDLEAVWIGRIIGSPKNAPYNIAFLVLVLAFGVGTALAFFRTDQPLEIWKYVAPIITLAMGYVFGQKNSEK
jgi:hypothetical protein